MKRSSPLIASFALALLFPSVAALASPEMRPSPVSKILIPNGFDDNDNVEIVLQGYYRNTCSKVGPTSYTVDYETKIITITANSYMYDTLFCAQVITPFLQVVKVGVMPEGEYSVRLSHDTTLTQAVTIKHRTTESPDDYLYAPVEEVRLDVDGATGRQSLLIKGTFPLLLHGCWIIREIRVGRDPADVIVVQPISEIIDNPECRGRTDRSFKIVQPMMEPFYGEGLLHIRVLNGNSINRFINIPR